MGGELRKWCLTTSIKGIPRIIRSRSLFLKFAWTVSVLFFISVAIEQTTKLTLNYLSYPSFTSLRKYHVNLSGTTKNSVQMPDLTVCNLNPFAGNASIVNGVLTMESFYNISSGFPPCVPY